MLLRNNCSLSILHQLPILSSLFSHHLFIFLFTIDVCASTIHHHPCRYSTTACEHLIARRGSRDAKTTSSLKEGPFITRSFSFAITEVRSTSIRSDKGGSNTWTGIHQEAFVAREWAVLNVVHTISHYILHQWNLSYYKTRSLQFRNSRERFYCLNNTLF